MARVYADVNQSMPRSYWDYDSVNISKRDAYPSRSPWAYPWSSIVAVPDGKRCDQ